MKAHLSSDKPLSLAGSDEQFKDSCVTIIYFFQMED